MSFLSFNFNPAIAAIQRSLSSATESLRRISERLASGQRINRASDDAAGLAVSSSLSAQSRIYSQGIRNANDAVSALNVADGSLGEMSGMLTRMRELAVQASSGTVSNTQRRSLNAEAQALASEFQRVQNTATFNGIPLLGNTESTTGIQIGSGRFGTMNINLGIHGTGYSSSTDPGSGLTEIIAPTVATVNNTVYGLGDVNGDGADDLVVADDSSNQLRLLPSLGTSFDIPSMSLGYVGSAVLVAVEDFTGDNIADVLLGTSSGDVTLYQGGGGGGGTLTQIWSDNVGGLTAVKPLIADITGDDILDIVLANDDQLITLVGDGSGNFYPSYSSKSASASITSIAVGQFSGSADKDLVLSTLTGSLELFTGAGNGDFSSVSTLGYTGVRISSAGDLNGDGYDDLANAAIGGLQILGGNGAGGFSLLSSVATGLQTDIAMADFNNDGIMDTALFDGSNQLSVLLGNGDGSFSFFSSSAPISFGGFLTQLRIGDLNGDGCSDAFLTGGSEVVGFLAVPGDTSSTTTTEIPALGSFTLTSSLGALSALATIDSAIAKINETRGIVGSSMSRLGFALNTTAAMRDNYQAAAGRILDADMAFETANYTRASILQQTGAALLAHANVGPQLLLSLLRPD